MSKLLSSLLNVNIASFNSYIERLEKVTLHPGIDIKLSAEITTKSREKIRNLDLNPSDTTAKELYFALRHKLTDDDKKLQKVLDLDNPTSDKISKVLAENTNKLVNNDRCLSLTTAGTKKVLQAVPPKKTLRLLKYRSLDSVLKRENPKLLYAIANLVEEKYWLSQVHAKILRLNTKDVTWQKVEIVTMPHKWLEKMPENIRNRGILLPNPECGVIIVMPNIKKLKHGSLTYAIGKILQMSQEFSVFSLPYRKEAYLKGYRHMMAEIAHGKQPSLITMHGLTPDWKVVYELISKGIIENPNSDLDVIIGELNWETIEMKLASLVPEYDFWVDTHYLGVKSEANNIPASMHILDIAHSMIKESQFGDHSVKHFEGSLWNEIQLRYLQEDNLKHHLINQLITDDVLELA